MALYVSSTTGLDTNPGTLVAPFGSLKYALTQVSATGTVIYLFPGVYYEGELNLETAPYAGLVVCGIGDVLINCTGFIYFVKITAGYARNFINLKITGWKRYFIHADSNDILYFFNCCIFQRGTKYFATDLCISITHNGRFYGCTVSGVKLASHTSDGKVNFCYKNCIIIADTNDYTLIERDYNASNQVDFRGANGWDTATYPPPFRSDSTSTPDLRFSGTHAQFSKYLYGGLNQCNVGAPVGSVAWQDWANLGANLTFNSATNKYSMYANTVIGGLGNDNGYYNSVFTPITIDSTSNKIDFKEAAGNLVATVASAVYTTGTALGAAVLAAMNTAGGTYTGTGYSELSKKITIYRSDSTALSLLWNTGANKANSAGPKLGFVITSDDTGARSYLADNTLPVNSPIVAGSTEAYRDITGRYITPNVTLVPDATTARFYTPVLDALIPQNLIRVDVGRTIVAPGEVDNDKDTTAREIEIRANSTSFLATAAGGTTTLDWTLLKINDSTDYTGLYRYWQARFLLRLDAS